MRTGIVIDERYCAHDTGRGHPERPARILAVLELLRARAPEGLVRIDPRPATPAEIALNHASAHLARVAASATREGFAFDADTPTCARSHDTAVLAAGGVVTLVDAIMAGDVNNGFAFVRPPGHHAEPDRAMGFCLFNNVAIGARVLRERHGVSRVAIVDFDVHHGNGTQRSFYDDPTVLFLSTHQYPFYPGSGAADEIGVGAGAGFTINVPLAAGSGDPEFVETFVRVVAPILRQFRPEFILVSAGFDCHRRDPLGGLAATEAGIGFMMRVLLNCAYDTANGRLACVLEGGYDLDALRTSTAHVLDALGRGPSPEPYPDVAAGPITALVRRVHGARWELSA
jgi:acetoin utilization deacetylase AcuC-like enzyme